MQVLVPIDGSDASTRALEFGAEFARRYGSSVHVVHFSERSDERASALLDDAGALLAEEGVEFETEVVTSARLSDFRASTCVGEDIADLVEDRGFDHVVTGHHSAGRIEGFVLGSAAERVVADTPVPVTVVP